MSQLALLLLCVLNVVVNGVEIPIYPSMLTPTTDEANLAAYPNNIHASIQYGEEGAEKQIIDRHFQHNGYSNYQHMHEENKDQKVGLSDVIHSVGAFFHVIESFPKLSKSFNQKHDLTGLVGEEIRKPSSLPSSSFSFPDDEQEDYDGGSNQESLEQPFPNPTTASLSDETTTFETLELETTVPSLKDISDSEATSSVITAFPTAPVQSRPAIISQSNDEDPWTTLSQVNRHQCTYNDQVSFPCAGPDSKASFYKPTSVHRLRPGDIQIVAALGDALVAAQGALSSGITSAGDQYRGVSFATGGDEDWRTVLTLPNILREFNPRLIGTSAGKGGTSSGYAGFNVADNFAFSKDLQTQAEKLISRIKRNVDADFREDWKLVLVLIGQNDLCKLACIHNGTLSHLDGGNNRPQSADEFARNIKDGLDTLMKGLPKSLVALILPPDPTLTMEAFHRPLVCHLSSKVICPCVDGPHSIGRAHMLKIHQEYQQALIDLVDDEGYDQYNDFAVVVQPALKELKLPKNFVTFFGIHKSFLPDLSYLSSDCFHPSQKLQALYAKNIWNNILEPVGAKSYWRRYAALQCPTSERPFLATKQNSDYEEDAPFERKIRRRRRKRKRTKRAPFFDVISPSYGDATCDIL